MGSGEWGVGRLLNLGFSELLHYVFAFAKLDCRGDRDARRRPSGLASVATLGSAGGFRGVRWWLLRVHGAESRRRVAGHSRVELDSADG